jgi:Flavoprotein
MSETAVVKENNSSCPNHEELHILLGITGSVAAIKAPELICSFIAAFGANVVVNVVLTKGGCHFWEKSSAYDATSWGKLQEYMQDPCRKQVEVFSKYWFVWNLIHWLLSSDFALL